MNGEACQRPGCTGVIDEGYCSVCGHAPAASAAKARNTQASVAAPGTSARTGSLATAGGRTGGNTTGITTGTGSSPLARSSHGSRRTSHASSRTTQRLLGAGLITLPDLPSIEPERAILLDPVVPERKRFCAKCESPLKREAGFCGKCGTRYSFVPALKAGDVVAGQYEVRGPIAFGGLGWIYLGFDRLLSRYVVLKGLLNTQDESAAQAALAERRFLAAVKHPNIVGVYNFVEAGGEGFIVMEYVNGKTLKQIRQERGPLPPAEAIAYIHRILPAFAYLHRMGLVYCDFKPDNVMFEKDDVKLIDMGGVRRIDDSKGDIYGTIGYSAPEAGEGPTPLSDLFTIGRTLTVLLTDIRGFTKEHRYTLPTPAEEPGLAARESLYRLLLKATAHAADDRFETADEMADQLLGVLREVVAIESGVPRPGTSLYFGGDLLALEAGDELESVAAERRYLPSPSIEMSDPAAQAVTTSNAIPDTARRIASLRLAAQQAPRSREARLRLAAALPEQGAYDEAATLLSALEEEDAWDWRVLWYRAEMLMAQAKYREARAIFDQVYFDLPGEPAPKLALGMAAELEGDRALATKMYELVARTDPGYVSSVFGLARCRYAAGDRTGAVAALSTIPASSALYLRSRMEIVRLLVRGDRVAPKLEDLAQASQVAESLSLDGMNQCTLAAQIYAAAVAQVSSRATPENATTKLLGQPLQERALRFGLERALRSMAQLHTGAERLRLVDQANAMRPRTLV